MDRPYIICHMVTSVDGKVTGDFLGLPECGRATSVYYDINRTVKSNGFICGRVTMEGSFTQGWYPDLSQYDSAKYPEKKDFIPDELSGFYAVAFDTNGKLGWKGNKIIDPDGDPGYDGAQIIEILSENVDGRYLSYLKEKGIAYIFAGEKEIDVKVALSKLKKLTGAHTLLLEGGSIINGAFQRADVIDEISLVTAPVVAEKGDKSLFFDGATSLLELIYSEMVDGVIVSKYNRKK